MVLSFKYGCPLIIYNLFVIGKPLYIYMSYAVAAVAVIWKRENVNKKGFARVKHNLTFTFHLPHALSVAPFWILM